MDFAYQMHTELGNRCVGAKVNGRLMPLSTVLHRGDIVEIFTHASSRPVLNWLGFVKTGKARRHIRRILHTKKTQA